MKQSSNYSRQTYYAGGSGYRHDSGGGEFKTILLFYVLPFIVVNAFIFFLVMTKPKCEITIGETSDYVTTTVSLKVKSFLPTKKPVVSLDSTPIEMTKTAKNTYEAVLTSNGVLEVNVESINKMKSVTFEQIGILDDTPPTISDNILSDGILSFKLDDTQAGVDYSSIAGSDEDTANMLPLSVDEKTGLVTIEMPSNTLTVSVRDKLGNENHVTFNANGESTTEEALEDQQEEAVPEESVQ